MTIPTPLDALKDAVHLTTDHLDTLRDHLGGNYDDHDFEDELSIVDDTIRSLWESLAQFIPGIEIDRAGLRTMTPAARRLVSTYDDGSPVYITMHSRGMVYAWYPRHDNMSRENRQLWLDETAVVHAAEGYAYEAAHPPAGDL